MEHLIPPHSTFSFNDAIGGTATLDDGYQMGYGIVIKGGEILTVPSVAGGICQVATTVFQAAFWAGMPIETRSWHLYWIPRYGNGSGGLTGLDATVDPDFGLDFEFKQSDRRLAGDLRLGGWPEHHDGSLGRQPGLDRSC